jgi:shikimate 5-dehydrogenase
MACHIADAVLSGGIRRAALISIFDLDYENIGQGHYCYDLVYNPSETKFLQKAKANGAKAINGYDMLVYQAEKSWEIWNS